MKKKWILIGIIIFAAIFLIYEYLFPHVIKESYSSIVYSIESKFEKQTIVAIKGKLHKNVFVENVFVGEMIIDENLRYDINLKSDGQKYFGALLTEDSDFLRLETIGSVMTSTNFDKIWIQLDDMNDKYYLTEGYISGPATNSKEANDIARTIMGGH